MQAGGRNPRTIRIIVILVVIILAASAATAYYVFFSQSSACNFTSTNPLIFDQPERPDTLDPHTTFSTPGWGIVQQVYQSLVNYNGSSYVTFVPVLAKSWTVSADGFNYTFVLRQDVHFSNGDPFNAYVMWFSLYRAIVMNRAGSFILQENFWYPGVNYYSDANDSANSSTWVTNALNTWDFSNPSSAQQASMAADNNSFQAVDRYTLVLKTGNGYLGYAPYAFLLASIAGPIASAVDPIVIRAHGGVVPDADNTWMTTSMIGTGPYVLSGGFLDLTSAPSYTINPDPNYWGKNAATAEPLNNIIQPGASSIQIDFQGDPAIAVNDMKTGKVVASSFAYIGPSTVNTLKGVQCVSVNALDNVYGSTAGGWWIYMNQASEPFTNWSVRQAVVHAINYARIIQVAFGGYADRISAEGDLDDPSVVDRVDDGLSHRPIRERLAGLIHVDPPAAGRGSVNVVERVHRHTLDSLQGVHRRGADVCERGGDDFPGLHVVDGDGRIALEVDLDRRGPRLDDVVQWLRGRRVLAPVVRVRIDRVTRGAREIEEAAAQHIRSCADHARGHPRVVRVGDDATMRTDHDWIDRTGNGARNRGEQERVRGVPEVAVPRLQDERVSVDGLERVVVRRHTRLLGRAWV